MACTAGYMIQPLQFVLPMSGPCSIVLSLFLFVFTFHFVCFMKKSELRTYELRNVRRMRGKSASIGKTVALANYRAFLPSVLLAEQDGSSSFFSWLHQLSVDGNKTYRPTTDQRVSFQQITPRIRSMRFSSFSP